jgi:glycosyltransferase involved in cell wall biosynthesis
MRPLLSICIPTYNRADLLDYCLTNLAPLKDWGRPVEVVISDNGSTDRTQDIIDAHRTQIPALRSYRFPDNQGPAPNWLNALRKADGEFVTYLADDDSIIIEGLLHHVETLEKQKDLVAIYADWIAWDDQAGCEFRRHYDGLSEFVSFGAGAPLDLVNFMLNRFYPPEIGIYRRAALLRAYDFSGRTLPYYMRMYRLSRLGRVAFDPLPFYREHRHLKDRFKRSHWMNMEAQFHLTGDELRLALEAILLMAVQDAGASATSPELARVAQGSIDRILHSRIGLEVERACGRNDWIMAVELRRRHVLWYGTGSDQDTDRDIRMIVIPAALQAVQKTFRSLTDASGVSLRGFESGKVAEFFALYFPDLPILAPQASPECGADPLILHRDERTLAQDHSVGDPSRVMVLEQQLDLYRIASPKIDLKGF